MPDKNALRQRITAAIADPDNQILSLIFPFVERRKDVHGDTAQAHLADVDLNFDPEVVTSLISKSKARSARILGGEFARNVTAGAKAKVTFDLSVEEHSSQEQESKSCKKQRSARA